jgi:hypothetical protein
MKVRRRQPLLGNSSINTHVAMDMHTAIEELLETVFSVRSVLRLYYESLQLNQTVIARRP